MIYFDLIGGAVSSILALTGITYFTIMYGITNYAGWLTGLIFWILYLILSIFLIFVGLYSKYKEKHYDPDKRRKKLRAPIVS
jgi:hypothetical protein